MHPDGDGAVIIPNSPALAFNKVLGFQLNGQHTDVVCHKFANKICLFITQFERINNIFVVQPNGQEHDLGTVRNEYREIVHQFGTDTDEIQSAIRHVVSRVPWLNESSVDVVINLGLKQINRAILVNLVAMLNDLFV